ncbi:MAG: FeoB-associated Cys-rich membrane protein [Pseudomonadota bacterium]
MGNALVVIIVALAGAYVFKAYYKKWRGREACSSGCGSCDRAKNCTLPGEDGP